MAVGSIMLQIEVEQHVSPAVTQLPEIWTVVFASLDGDRTVVREIASEKNQMLVISATQTDAIVPALGMSQFVATDVWLTFDDRRPPSILHAPSHVPSPPIDGARLALLRVRDPGLIAHERVAISTRRRVGSHVYLDETVA